MPEREPILRWLRRSCRRWWIVPSFALCACAAQSVPQTTESTFHAGNPFPAPRFDEREWKEGRISDIGFWAGGEPVVAWCIGSHVRILAWNSSDPIAVLDGGAGEFERAWLLRDTGLVAAVYSGHRSRDLSILNARTGRELGTVDVDGRAADLVQAVAISADSRRIGVAGITQTYVVNAHLGVGARQVVPAAIGGGNSVDFAPDKPVIAVGGGSDGITIASAHFDIPLWDFVEERQVSLLSGHKGVVLQCRFSRDGRLLASAAVDRTVRLWDVESGAEHRVFEGHEAPVSCVRFSPGGMLLVSGGWDGRVVIWNVPLGEKVLVLGPFGGRVWSVEVSPSGRGLLILIEGNRVAKVDLLPPAGTRPAPSGELESIWHTMGGEDAEAAFEAVRLMAAQGDRGAAYLQKVLADQREEDWWSPLLARLDDEDPVARAEAFGELRRRATEIDRELRSVLESAASLHVRDQVHGILLGLDPSPPPRSREVARRLRAIQVLEWIGSARAAGLLERMAGAARSTVEAEQAKAAAVALARRGVRPASE
jgi:hypothetical protein